MEHLPYLERVKIQSEILLPLYRRLRETLGEEQAASLLREAVADFGRQMGEQIAEASNAPTLDKLRGLLPAFMAGDALDVEPLADNDTEIKLNVRGCRYAEYFRSIGEPEFGAMLTCEIDPPMTTGIDKSLTLERTQTWMSTNKPCDFRWKLAQK